MIDVIRSRDLFLLSSTHGRATETTEGIRPDLLGETANDGPLDEKTARLIKLGVAIGAMREGAVHLSVRKAKALGASPEELDQVVAIAASVIGMPSAVAVWTWISERQSLRRSPRIVTTPLRSGRDECGCKTATPSGG